MEDKPASLFDLPVRIRLTGKVCARSDLSFLSRKTIVLFPRYTFYRFNDSKKEGRLWYAIPPLSALKFIG